SKVAVTMSGRFTREAQRECQRDLLAGRTAGQHARVFQQQLCQPSLERLVASGLRRLSRAPMFIEQVEGVALLVPAYPEGDVTLPFPYDAELQCLQLAPLGRVGPGEVQKEFIAGYDRGVCWIHFE